MTDQERNHVVDLLAAHDALIHWCETLTTAHADLVELASDADLLNSVDTDEHNGPGHEPERETPHGRLSLGVQHAPAVRGAHLGVRLALPERLGTGLLSPAASAWTQPSPRPPCPRREVAEDHLRDASSTRAVR